MEKKTIKPFNRNILSENYSLRFFVRFSKPKASCLWNKPIKTKDVLPRILPGKLLSVDEQCFRAIGGPSCGVRSSNLTWKIDKGTRFFKWIKNWWFISQLFDNFFFLVDSSSFHIFINSLIYIARWKCLHSSLVPSTQLWQWLRREYTGSWWFGMRNQQGKENSLFSNRFRVFLNNNDWISNYFRFALEDTAWTNPSTTGDHDQYNSQ